MKSHRFAIYTILVLLIATAAIGQVRSQTIQGVELESFLKLAKILQAKNIPTGIALPKKLSLELNGVTHFSAFKSIDETKAVMKFEDGTTEYNFRDSWRDEIAAYEVDKLIGLEMVPATVEKKFAGKTGSAQFWVDSMFAEAERLKRNVQPPNPTNWDQQVQKVRLFDNLIYNMDRHLNNLLITKDWELVLIDHSRSFRLWNQLKEPAKLERFSKALLEGIQKLNEQNLKEKIGKYASKDQIKAVLKRRDLIIEHSKKLVALNGEAKVLYP